MDKNKKTKTVRVKIESFEILREMAYKQNKKIVDIIQDLLKKK